jgi:hypothetical protein
MSDTSGVTLGGLPIEKWIGRRVLHKRFGAGGINAKLVHVNNRGTKATIVPMGHGKPSGSSSRRRTMP